MKFLSALLFLISILQGEASKGQSINSHRVDSLRKALKHTIGSEKPQVFLEIAKLYTRSQLDSSTKYAAMAEAIYKKSNQDTSLLNLYLTLSQELGLAGHEVTRVVYLRKASNLLRDDSAPRFAISFHQEFGDHYHYEGNYDSAVWHFGKALLLAQDPTTKITALKNIAYSYNASGQTVKALGNYMEALRLLEKINNPLLNAQVLMRIGVLYEDDGDNARSEEYFKKALPLYQQANNARGLFALYNNMGILYDHQQRYTESLTILYKAESLLPQLDVAVFPAKINLNIGNTLAHMERAAEAIPHFNKALKIFNDIKDNYGITLAHRQLGEAYFKIGRYVEAEKFEMQAIDLAKKYGFDMLKEDAAHDLHAIYETTKDYEKAFKYLTIYLAERDSAASRSRRSKIGLLEKEYELSRQEEARQELERENEIHKAQAQVDKITRISLAAGLALIMLVGGVAANAYYRTRSKNKLLASQKAKIEEANTLITEQSQQLQEVAKTKARFFANVSHELRTPVTLLNGMLELMHKDFTVASAVEPAATIQHKMKIALANSSRLQSLVDEVLDLSRLEMNKVVLKRNRRELVPLLSRIVFAFESLLVRKNIALTYEVSELSGIFLDLDEDKFEKIINNLIYNAIKFNRENGWIKITGQLPGSNESAIIRIIDGGIGIDEKDLPHIFNRFYQSNSASHKHAQGIGIGLSLVKEFTQLHGGDVHVTSKLNEGTSFSVCLPLSQPGSAVIDDELVEPVIADITFAEFDKLPVVLFVEDNEEMRFYLKEIFAGTVTLVEAKNGLEGLAWLKTNTPDLIISDVMMPEMDGYEFLTRLKSSEQLNNLPVIMLTARASEDDLLYGLGLGVDDYIVKPFNAKELKIRVHNLLVNHRMRKQWREQPVQKEEEKVEVIENSDNKLFLQKVQQFVEERAQNSLLGIIDLADHMAMSERQLYRKCGLLTGMTPAQLIKEVRLKMAYKLLLERNVTKVSELASRIGFDNSAYFSRQFLERFGKRPAEFL